MNDVLVEMISIEGPRVHIGAPQHELDVLANRLPPPFSLKGRGEQTTWRIDVSTGSLERSWPDESRIFTVCRPAGTEPFPWLVEHLSNDCSRIWLIDERNGERAYIGVDRVGRRVDMILETIGGRWLARIVKTIFGAHMLCAGWIPLHACAFSVGTHTVICTGQTGSGKSSLAFLAACVQGAKYVGDNIVLVRPVSASEWDVVGWPARIGIRRALLNQVLGTSRVGSFEAKLRRRVVDGVPHPRGERLAFEHDELAHFGVRYVGHERSPIRIVQVSSSESDKETMSWSRGLLDPKLEAQPFDRRYLSDPLGLFAIPAPGAAPRPNAYSTPLDMGELSLPHNVPKVLDHLWRDLTRPSVTS